MSGNKRRLEAGNRYQVVVATWRAARMLCGRGCAAEILDLRLEDEEADGWDDIVETYDSPSGPARRRIQVKSGGELAPAEFARMLSSVRLPGSRLLLHGAPRVTCAGMGRVDDLWRLPDLATAAAGRVARIRMVTGYDEDEVVRLLGGFRCEFTGPPEDVERRTESLLADLYEEGTYQALYEQVHGAFVSGHRLRGADLEAELRPRELRTRPRRSLLDDRRTYLAGLREQLGRARPLAGLAGDDIPWALHDVLVTARVEGSSSDLCDHVGALEEAGTSTVSLTAPMGQGKSVALQRLAEWYALRAEANEGSPVPILLSASRLDGPPLWGDPAIAERLVGRGWPTVILVDGLDEVPVSDLRDARLRQIAERPGTKLLVVAGRPGSMLASAARLRLAAWSELDASNFLARWRALDPTAVDRFAGAPASKGLLSSPLLATYALLLARSHPEAIRSRASLFDGITCQLFGEWVGRKGGASADEALVAWSNVRNRMAPIAWLAIKEGRSLTEAEVRSALSGTLPEPELARALGHAKGQLGLLVRGEDGFHFFSRPIAEYLAGRAVVLSPEIVRLARPVWRWLEVLRHAAAIAPDERLWTPVLETLVSVDARPANSAVAVGSALAAIAITTEIGDAAAASAAKVGQRCAALVCEEHSVWVGEEVSRALTELARAGGPTWGVVEELLGPVAKNRYHHPVAWYAGRWQAEETMLEAIGLGCVRWLRRRSSRQGLRLAGWLERFIFDRRFRRVSQDHPWDLDLLHRDAGIRALVLDRLARASPWNDSRRSYLLATIADGGYAAFVDGPVVTAAKVLGDELRASRRQETPLLVAWLGSRSQAHRTAACIALPPGVHDADRASVLAEERDTLGDTTATAAELAAAGFASVVEAGWPQWRTTRRPPLIDPAPAPRPPPSIVVRRRALSVLSGGVGAGQAIARELLAGAARLSYEESRFVSEVAAEDPDIGAALLERAAREVVLFDDQTSRNLGKLAVRFSSISTALLALHASVAAREQRVVNEFPGLALEPLTVTDETAEAAFAAWLPHGFNPMASGWSPSPDSRRLPTVQAALSRMADDYWNWGREEKGPPRSVSQALVFAWPAWDASPIMDGVFAWLEGEDDSRVSSAIAALTVGPLPEPWAGRLRASLPRALAGMDARNSHFLMQQALAIIAAAGEPPAGCAAVLAHLMDGPSSHDVKVLAAAASLRLVATSDAAQLSSFAAAAWKGRVAFADEKALLALFVPRAPDAWGEAALRLLAQHDVLSCTSIIWHLPLDLARSVLERVPPEAEGPLWTGAHGDGGRPADIFERLRYDLGID